MKIKVAITQMSCSNDYQKNIAKAEDLVQKCAKNGANVVLIQELFSNLYFCQVEDYDKFALAEEADNSYLIKHFQEVAKKYNVVLPISFFEKSGPNYFNSLVMIDADGKNLGLYRKTHIPTGQCYEEKFYFSPGDTGFKVFKTKFGKIGIGICWDQWFPETARCLALNGAQLLLYPTAIGSEPVLVRDSMPHWRNTMCGHAAANIIPVCASNRVGKEVVPNSEMVFQGYSFIADQYGNVVEEMNREEEGFRIHEFDLDAIDHERVSWGVFRDRRPECYQDIIHYGKNK
ncbi:MAG: N-carbamoylputrescine amidase [Bacilli bacterium]|nr:N-carbamoylputrescine amidase [Bacilli bacterium]MBR0302194.1 N-carbamoylputrescine amidase [Bacilli bacterium]